MLIKSKQISEALKEGGIILYPTEGVFGLGCDPFNKTAVLRLLKIKRRPIDKGLILIAANWQQVQDLVKTDLEKYLKLHRSLYPTTWVFPATKKVPFWITGKRNTVAIRVTSHPIARKICQKFGGPIVSTSANITNKRPIRKLININKSVLQQVDLVVPGTVGNLGKPTRICDIRTREVFRK